MTAKFTLIVPIAVNASSTRALPLHQLHCHRLLLLHSSDQDLQATSLFPLLVHRHHWSVHLLRHHSILTPLRDQPHSSRSAHSSHSQPYSSHVYLALPPTYRHARHLHSQIANYPSFSSSSATTTIVNWLLSISCFSSAVSSNSWRASPFA